MRNEENIPKNNVLFSDLIPIMRINKKNIGKAIFTYRLLYWELSNIKNENIGATMTQSKAYIN